MRDEEEERIQMGQSAKVQATDPELSLLDGLPVAVISDVMDGLGFGSTVMDGVRLLSGHRICGRARTVERAPAPFNATQADIAPALGTGTQQVIDSGKPGDVIVIAAQGNGGSAMWGGNMGTRASSLGVLGLVTDGVVRDLEEMDALGLTIFGGGQSPRQAYKRMITRSINQPIACGGVWVRPGDLIVGDGDGVVVVPPARAAEVAEKARATIAAEGVMQKFIREGNSLVAAVEKYKIR
jgi:regulator of RNase E activity RraA